MSELTFVHLSDTHIGPQGRLQYGADTAENLRRVAQHIQHMALDPISVVISGDLSDHGEIESYQYIRTVLEEAFAPFDVPVLLNLGNHDLRLPFRQVFLHDTTTTDEALPWYYSRDLHGIRFIMLDSKLPEQIHGALDAPQLAWLESELQQPAAVGHIVVLHHPSVPRGVPRPDDYLLANREAFAKVIRRGANVLGVLCGHSHVSTSAVFAGTLHVAAPATAYLFDPSLRTGSRGLDGCGFNLCTVREGRLIVNPILLPGEQRELYRRA